MEVNHVVRNSFANRSSSYGGSTGSRWWPSSSSSRAASSTARTASASGSPILEAAVKPIRKAPGARPTSSRNDSADGCAR